jgi:hypothetical protein
MYNENLSHFTPRENPCFFEGIIFVFGVKGLYMQVKSTQIKIHVFYYCLINTHKRTTGMKVCMVIVENTGPR